MIDTPSPVVQRIAIVLNPRSGNAPIQEQLCEAVRSAALHAEVPFVLVGNGEYEVEGTQFGRRPTMAGGTLSLYLTPDSGRFSVLVLPFRALLRTLKRHDKFETYTASTILMNTTGSRIEVALDGEIRNLEPPLRFSIRREALRTIVPAGEA